MSNIKVVFRSYNNNSLCERSHLNLYHDDRAKILPIDVSKYFLKCLQFSPGYYVVEITEGLAIHSVKCKFRTTFSDTHQLPVSPSAVQFKHKLL